MKSKTSFLYFFFTLAFLCIFTMGRYRFDSNSLKKNYEKYQEIEANVVEINLNRNGYIATLSKDGEILKRKVYISDEEAERIYDEMGYDSSDVNRIKKINLTVRMSKNGNVYSEEDYKRACSGENPDGGFYTVMLIISILSFGRIMLKGSLKIEK